VPFQFYMFFIPARIFRTATPEHNESHLKFHPKSETQDLQNVFIAASPHITVFFCRSHTHLMPVQMLVSISWNPKFQSC
jgi:hypothetical protein